MNDWIKRIFHGPIKNEESFWFIKSEASIKYFIESFEYKSTTEEQFIILNQLIKILSYNKSIINICIINNFNEDKIQTENNLINHEKSNKLLSLISKQDKINFVDWLIKQYFLYKSEKKTKGILNLLRVVISVVDIKKTNLYFIYQKISDYFFFSTKKNFHEEDKLNISNDLNNLNRFLNLLLLIYGNNMKLTKPYNFYYFGSDGYLKMELPKKHENILYLKGGLTIFSCFNCLYSPKYFNQNYSIIFSIEFNNDIYFSLLIDKEMNIILSNENLNVLNNNNCEIKDKIIVSKIENDGWYNIMVSLNIKKNKKFLINIIANSIELDDTFEIENNNSVENIENIILYKNFIGLSTSFLLYNTNNIDIKNYNIFYNEFQYGFYKISHINKFINKQELNNLKHLIILIIPSQIKSNNFIQNFANFTQNFVGDDLILLEHNTISFKFIQNFNNDNSNEQLYLSGININKRLYKNILLIGGINNIFPFFEILLDLNKKIFDTKNFIYLNILQNNILCLLHIIEVIINNNQKEKIKKIINKKFFKILSIFLEKINVTYDIEPTIFNDKLIAIFKNIGNNLINNNLVKKLKTCKIFFNKILLNINIIKKFSIPQQIKISDYIYNCILNNNILLLDYKNIILFIKYIDNIYGYNYCCKEHYLFIKEINYFDSKFNYNKMLTNLLDINTKLLNIIIKNEVNAYIELLNLLITGKNSPCTIELILQNIFIPNLKNINKDINNLKKIFINLLNNKFLYILLYLLSIYIYPNIIKLIIELFFIISNLSKTYNIKLSHFFNNPYIINYISNAIYPINLKIREEYISNLDNNIDYKFNHFFSSNILPKFENDYGFINFSFSEIKRCNTYDRFQIKAIKLENTSKNNIKINRSQNILERKKIMSNTIKVSKYNSFKQIKKMKNKSKEKKKKQQFNLSFEKENNKRNIVKDRLSLKILSHKNSTSNNIIIVDDYNNNNIFLLNKLENDKKFIFKRKVLDSLINWININPSKFIFEIIIKFFRNINYEYINLDKFFDSFNQILFKTTNEENYSLNDLIDIKTFKWFFEITFQFYLLKNKIDNFLFISKEKDKIDLIDNIIFNGKKIIVNIFLYNVNNNKYDNMINGLNYIMNFTKEIKRKYQKENEINKLIKNFYQKILIDLLNISQNILLFLINNEESSSDSDSDSGFYIDDEKEYIIISILNLCYEFVFYNNIENKYEEINNFFKSQSNNIFNNILLSDININIILNNKNNGDNNNNKSNIKEEDNFSLKKYLTDFLIFEKMILIIKPFISLNKISNYEDDKFLNNNILNIKESNKYFIFLNILCRNNIKHAKILHDKIPLVYIFSNLYIFYLNLSKNKSEVDYILDNYKSFIIFLIISTSNLYDNEEDKEITLIINNIKNKIIIVINYYIYYLYDKYKRNNEIIEKYLIDVFKLMIRIMNIINIQTKTKNLLLSNISTEKIKEVKITYKYAIHEIFLNEVMIKIFTKDYISTLVKDKFKEFNDVKYFLGICSQICVDSNLRQELKKIFNIDSIINKYIEDNNNINDEIFIEFYIDDIDCEKIKEKINDKIKGLIPIFNQNNNFYCEKIYIRKLKYKNKYKSIKKKLFGYNGYWKNINLFGDCINNVNNDNNGETFKYKIINHYTKDLYRNILLPIFDLDNYISRYQFINKNSIFKVNKNINNINYFRKSIVNLDLKKIFINLNEESFKKNSILDNNNIQYCLIEEIRKNTFPDLNDYINRECNNNIFEFNKNVPKTKLFLINNSYSCCYIKPDTHYKGYLSMKDKKLEFIIDIYNNIDKFIEDDFDKERGCCYGCLIKYKNNNKFISFSIKYSSIKFVFLRSYYYKDSALEIFTTKNKSYYINFHNSKLRKYIIDIILIHFNLIQEIKTTDNILIGYYLSNNNNNFFINDMENDLCNNKISYDMNDIIKKWIYWEITTFDFLILLNIFSNRSFDDLTQYPVFPWIIIQYNDFNKLENKENMEKESKKENNDNNYESEQNDNKDDDIIKQIEDNLNSILQKSSIKSSSIKSKYNNSIENEEINNNFKLIDISSDIRDFSIPMGMIALNKEGEKRKKYYLDKLNSIIKNNFNVLNNNYIYNTHYSNPRYISGYLSRIFPFLNINIELNGKKIINNEDLLISIDATFKKASSKIDDLRELCPEFFYLPEMFININYLDLKIGNNKDFDKNNEKLSRNDFNYIKEKNLRKDLKMFVKEKRIQKKKNLEYFNNNQKRNDLLMDINDINNYNYDSNDVLIPKWADNNPYFFVSKMKTFLELETVGKTINKWFDLIFGYKQKGKKSLLSNNVFPPWTYDNFDIRKIKNDKNNDKNKNNKSFYYKLVEQGQTPHQLLNNPFPQRLSKITEDFSISFMRSNLKYNSFKNKKKLNIQIKRKVLKIKFLNNDKVICVFNLYQYAIFDLLKYALIVDIKIDYIFKFYLTKEMISKYNYLLIKDFQIISLNSPIIIYSQGRYIAQGGFYGGLILLSELDLEIEEKTKNLFSSIINITEIFNKIDYSPIISLITNNTEEVILAGTYMGSIIIYDINWNIKYALNDHQHMPITSIYFSDELFIWGSTGMDGFVKIYTYPTNKSILSMKVEQSSIYADYLLITSSPLPSFIIYSKNNLFFYCYSLIGKLIVKDKEDFIDIKSPIIFKDNYGNDKLLYGDDAGSINIRFLPTLELLPPFEINDSSINLINMSNNRRFCSGWSDEEEEIYIIFDPILME